MDILEKELLETIKNNKEVILRTQSAKEHFIKELKNGLGEELKNSCNKITIIKKPFSQKIVETLVKFFTKF